MPIVRVEPLGAALDLLPGEAVAVGAWRLGYWWPTTCWGQADCMLCRTTVDEGEDRVVPPDDEELDALDRKLPASQRRPGTRLACRLVVTGDGVVVHKDGVRRP